MIAKVMKKPATLAGFFMKLGRKKIDSILGKIHGHFTIIR
ncbi:hypothetical protein A11S_341 [Micavibrio aeruginosavorus EPB]|uniref:Uncharacterized protein n=1 Tax=Micavibrio aeruginosavorus EPB TaxID=349215 RepID=M4VGJ5_9BACT|nr:hypothetical protein A11S_341 [Micavibrio aeruginosavorus EPB]